ncbi:MAG: glycosyltransferase, partial [Acidobacteria bacterium]|nr:glycosyltransferase [Acidobacteriota bacterium]
GRALLARCIPLLLAEKPAQVIIVDNGSDDGTLDWMAAEYSSLEVVFSAEPLSFSAAINRGLIRVRYSHVCLLNNDMEVEPGFLSALAQPFEHRPELFASTAQIFFPEGQRRKETGKAVLPTHRDAFQFPLRCDDPLPGEDGSPVLYGSGGCTLFSTVKLRQLGGLDESFTPAYVEDFDLGVRAWQQGWPTVFTEGARVLHRHRSTTSRYFSPEEIQLAVERNYLRSVARNGLYELWREAIERLNRQQNLPALRFAATLQPTVGEPEIAAGSGDIVRFPGRGRQDGPRIRIASCYAPYPLSHGGAVRMYNLMRLAAPEFSQTLLYFADQLSPPPPELLDICAEVIVVRRHGTHVYPDLSLPDPVQEFSSPAFRAALELAAPAAVTQLEFTQMAQYAPTAGAILVEHDVTIDLYQQLASRASAGTRWELERQLRLWQQFETAAWQRCSRIVVMSDRDRATVSAQAGAGAVVVLPNGVDIDRYLPPAESPQPGRLLFIGSFAHLPNLMAIQWFVEQVWTQLEDATLHVIAGARPEYYRAFYRDRATVNLEQPGIELESFVSDVRPAYAQAQIVIAPLLASAGTNIKILEAMAMGKAIVSTPAGIHGLDLQPGHDVVVVETAAQMADAIKTLMADPQRVAELGEAARATVVERYSWDRMADEQRRMYQRLIAEME